MNPPLLQRKELCTQEEKMIILSISEVNNVWVL